MLVMIGQDTDSIDDYNESTQIVPGGVTNYTSVSESEGTHQKADYGSGPHNRSYLAQTYPGNANAVELQMVDYLTQTGGGQADKSIDKLLDALVS